MAAVSVKRSIPLIGTKETEQSEKCVVEISKRGKKDAADRKKATILVKVCWLGEKSALGMCERQQTDPAKNANRVTRAVGDLPRDRLLYPS